MTVEREKPALLIIDMLNDIFDDDRGFPITPLARQIVAPINHLIAAFRQEGWPIVFSNDAYHREDFIFTSRMKPHALAGTAGAEVIDELDRREGDLWLPKPRFSAFFQTDLDRWLREQGVTLCAVTGISTHFCVLTTVMDAICHDFKVVLVEDCTAAFSENLHEQTLALFRRNPIYPLLRVASAADLLAELVEQGGK